MIKSGYESNGPPVKTLSSHVLDQRQARSLIFFYEEIHTKIFLTYEPKLVED
jgi:hypothetical protein